MFKHLIYGLLDPRSRLIRYVGRSSSGLRRPRQHRTRAHGRCKNWIKSLHKLGLDYEIIILETLDTLEGLDDAERWWIAYGYACDWPLTNLNDGGGPSAEALARRRATQAARIAALHPPSQYTDEVLAEFDRGRRIQDLGKLIEDPSTTAIAPTNLRARCFCLFDEGKSVRAAITALDLDPADTDTMGIVPRSSYTVVVPTLLKRLRQQWLNDRCMRWFDEGRSDIETAFNVDPLELLPARDHWLFERFAQFFQAHEDPNALIVEMLRLRFDPSYIVENSVRRRVLLAATDDKIREFHKRWLSIPRARHRTEASIRRLHSKPLLRR